MGISRFVKSLAVLLTSVVILHAAEPSRDAGLSVHMLPDRVAKLSGNSGGFTVTDPATKQPGATYSDPKQLVVYFEHLPLTIQQNGIWIVTTHPDSYAEAEQASLKTLGQLCKEKKIALFVCRAAELPQGWHRLE